MEHIVFNSTAYGEEIAQLVGTELPPRSASIARVRFGHLLGGAVFYNQFGTTSISAHVAGRTPYWLSRDLLYVLFDYPFRQLKVDRIFGFVPEDNPRAVQFNMKLGFTEVTRIPGMFKNNADCIVLKMERDDCRFLALNPRFIRPNRH